MGPSVTAPISPLSTGPVVRSRKPRRCSLSSELLDRWLAADHPWKPSTLVGYTLQRQRTLRRSSTRTRSGRVAHPTDPTDGIRPLESAGRGPAVVSGRFRALRAAIGWAYDERIIDTHPIRTMPGPARPTPRRPLETDALRRLLAAAESSCLEAVANDIGRPGDRERRHVAEQDLLLVRLAADSGARRGSLQHSSSTTSETGSCTSPCRVGGHDRNTEIGTRPNTHDRHSYCDVMAPTRRRLADPSRSGRVFGPWLFSPDFDHRTRLTTGALGHRFARLADRAGGRRRDAASPSAQRRHVPRRARPDPPSPSATRTRRRSYDVARVRLRAPSRRHGRCRRHRPPPRPTRGRRTGTCSIASRHRPVGR